MSNERVNYQFWNNARQKSGTNESNSRYYNSQRDGEAIRNLCAGPSVPTPGEPFTNVQGDEAKRQRVFDADESATAQHPPPSDVPLFKTSVDIGRRWQFTNGNASRHRSRSIPFTIISYNVLADYLLQSHPMLYDECNTWVLQWEYRKKNLLKEILHYNADILCLQEVQEQHYMDWFEPELSKAGYHGLYKKRTGDKADGCAIFYKPSKFALITVRNLNYKMDHVPLMDRDNVAILALFHPKYKDGIICNHTALCVATTHLLFNQKRGDIKLLQIASLFAEIDKLKKEFIPDGSETTSTNKIRRIPVVLCGDFNLTPFCPIYQYISKGTLIYDKLNKKELSGQVNMHSYSFRDILSGNIIPREMGLTNNSKWHTFETQPSNEQTVADASALMSNDADWPALTSSKSTEPSSGQNKSSTSCQSHEYGGKSCHSTPNERPVRWDQSSSASHSVAYQESQRPSNTYQQYQTRQSHQKPGKWDQQTRRVVTPQETSRPRYQHNDPRDHNYQELVSSSSYHSNARQVIDHRHHSNLPQRDGHSDQTWKLPGTSSQHCSSRHHHQTTDNASGHCREASDSRARVERSNTSNERGKRNVPQNRPNTSSQQSETNQSVELHKPITYNPECTYIEHRLYFKSAFLHFLQDKQREVTTYHGSSERACTVDYIFSSRGRTEMCNRCRKHHSVMELTGTLRLLSGEDVALLGGLPSAVLSSDHLALVASFALHL